MGVRIKDLLNRSAELDTGQAWLAVDDGTVVGKVSGTALINELLDKFLEAYKSLVGTPLVALFASDMTDEEKIYVYTGNEDGYMAGHWYYFDETWNDGGAYNSTAVTTDKTLSISDAPADSKKVGDELSAIIDMIPDIDTTLTVSGDTADAKVVGDKINELESVIRAKTVDATYVYGKAYRANTNVETSGNNYQYAKYQINGETEFIVYGHSYGGNGKWPMIAYINSNNETIKTENLLAGYYGPVKTTVPDNATWIIVNGAITGDATEAKIYVPSYGLYADDIARIDDALKSIPSVDVFDDYISVDGTITDGYARRTDGTDRSNDNYTYCQYNVIPGDRIIISGYHFSNTYPLILVYDNNDTLIYSSTYASAGVYTVIYDVPVNASYIIVNGNKAQNKGGNGYPNLRKLAKENNLHFSLLQEKTKRRYLFMGDSYCAGYTHGERNAGWAVYCAEYLGLSEGDYVRSAVQGSKFRTYGTQYITNIPTNYPADYFTDIVLCGGYNDRFDTGGDTDKEAELLSGMENVCAVFKEKYPYAKIYIGFIAYSKQGTGEGAVEDWLERRNVLINNVLPAYQKCTRFGATYLNNVEYWIDDSGLSPEDGYHPNEAGNRSIGQAVAHALMSGSAPLPHNESFRMQS